MSKTKRGSVRNDRSYGKIEAESSFAYNIKKEREKNAWAEATKDLPDDAFADDIEPDEDDTKGTVNKVGYHIETRISNYD